MLSAKNTSNEKDGISQPDAINKNIPSIINGYILFLMSLQSI